MRKNGLILLVLIGLTSTSFTYADKHEEPKDFLNVPGPIDFDKTNYNLNWSTHPNPIYYKQEYLPKGEKAERFKRMVLIDVLQDSVSLQTVVYGKVAELQKRKQESDPVVNYKLIQSPDSAEYILDFVVSQGTPTLDFVEWNAYRYKYISDESGTKGVMIFGVVMRSYGNNIRKFFASLKDTRDKTISELTKYEIPKVALPKSKQ